MPYYCPHPDCRKKCLSNRGVTYHLNHSPQCRTVTPSYHLQIQTDYSNKLQTPTAKKPRTTDTDSPFNPPPQFTNETYLQDGYIDTSSSGVQVTRPESPTLLDTAEPIDIFPTDEENELEVYLSKLSLDVEPTDNFQLGTRSKLAPNPQSPSASHSPATDSSNAKLGNTNQAHTLVPCPDFLSTGSDEESVEITPSEPIKYLDLTKETQANIELLKILCDMGAPLHAYQTLIQWALKHAINGYDFNTRHSTYGSMIAHLQRTFQMHEYRPTIYEIKLPCPSHAKFEHVLARVTTFDFRKLLYSLLSDPEINTPENLTIDPDHPFSEYPRHRRNAETNELETIPYGEVHTGDWYHRTWAQMVRRTNSNKTKFNKNFLIGVILYTDNTVLNITGGLCCHPVNFSLTIFTEKCRRNPKAWRTLGFLPQKQTYESRSQHSRSDSRINNKRYHMLMRQITASLVEAQDYENLNGIEMQIGGWTKKKVNLYTPVAFVIADVQEADQICSFYPSNTQGHKRVCRTCDVSVENACRTTVPCHRYTKDEILTLFENEDREGLAEINQRYVVNSYNVIDMGDDPHGIHGKCHTEMMHAVQEGIVKYLLEILMDVVLTETECSHLDDYISCMCQHLGDHGKDQFPRTSWKNGFSKLTHLTASDRMGKLFTCLLFLVTDKGSRVFDSFKITYKRLFKKHKDKDAIRIDREKEDMDMRLNFIEVFEMILCLWSWLKQDEFWHPGDTEYEEYVQDSIKTLINQMNHLLPRGKGRGWEITKVHELLHLVQDIKELGAHCNVNSDKCESSHKNLIKNPARNAQRRVQTLDSSLANRQVDRLIIDHAYSHVQQQSNQAHVVKEKKNVYQYRCTRGTLYLKQMWSDKDNSRSYFVKHEWDDHRHNSKQMMIHDQAVCFWPMVQALNSFNSEHRWFDDDTYQCKTLTECRTDDGVLLRCHPDYRSTGPWYDWVILDSTNGINGMNDGPCIARLISLLNVPRCWNNDEAKAQLAIVRPMLAGSLMDHSVLTRSFKLQDGYAVVPVSCIEQTTMCVPQDFGPETEINDLTKPFLWVLPTSDWAAEFVQPPVANGK